jgi:hypothetical protein
MIEEGDVISLELEVGSGGLSSILSLVRSLPGNLRPTHFGDSESDRRRRKSVDDSEQFEKFFLKRTSGFLLFGSEFECLASVVPNRTIRLSCSVGGASSNAEVVLKHFAAAGPIFGSACSPDERAAKNRAVFQFGANRLEAWVGRETAKYIPGLYWLTLLSSELSKRHGIELSQLERIALAHDVVAPNQHLFRFGDSPQSWKAQGESVSGIPGVFDISRVYEAVGLKSNFIDVSAILDRWK